VRLSTDTASRMQLRYVVYGTHPHPAPALHRLRIIAHGLKNGWFSMRCQWAESRGTGDANQFISERQLQPRDILTRHTDTGDHSQDERYRYALNSTY
jgi:hypothetical protein